jgi:hypothetical protein
MASSLRRRLLAEETPSNSREGTPDKAEEVRLVPVSKIKSSKHKGNGGKKRNGLIFFLGGLVGIIAAGLFARSNDLIDFPEFGSMDSLLDVLPATMVQDVRELIVCLHWLSWILYVWLGIDVNTERRARNVYFRLFFSRPKSSSARRTSQASCDNGSRSHFNWLGILEYDQ